MKDIPQGNVALDAARINIGSPWKMPTKNQCQELKNGTNPTWTTINGVNGRKFTSKKDSTKYIFLPAGGYWNEYGHNTGTCYYWTTTLYNTLKEAAFQMRCMSYGDSFDHNYRYYGLSVRAIN